MKDITPLTKSQLAQYEKLDTTITTGAKSFMATGAALVEMHESGFYRAEFTTFKKYIESRGISRSHAYRLMGAVQTTLEINGVPESGTRSTRINKGDVEKSSGKTTSDLSLELLTELGKYPKEKHQEILKLARAAGKPTAKRIAVAAAAIMHSASPGPTPAEAQADAQSDAVERTAPSGPTIIEHGGDGVRFRQPVPAGPITSHFDPSLPKIENGDPPVTAGKGYISVAEMNLPPGNTNNLIQFDGPKVVDSDFIVVSKHISDVHKESLNRDDIPPVIPITTVADALAFCKSTDEPGHNWETAGMMLAKEVIRLNIELAKVQTANTGQLTPKELLAELRKFKPRIPDTLPQNEREKYGKMINEMVKWLMNPVERVTPSPYTR